MLQNSIAGQSAPGDGICLNTFGSGVALDPARGLGWDGYTNVEVEEYLNELASAESPRVFVTERIRITHLRNRT